MPPGLRWDVDELVASHPEHDHGREHQHAGDAERDADARVLPDQRDREVREEAAEVDDEVERLIDRAQPEPVAAPELIADVRRHTRLDPARADRDQPQARPHTPDGMRAQRERQVAARVHDRQPEDRAVLPQQAIGDDRADHRQRVDRRDEQMEVRLGGGRRSGAEQRVVHVQLARQVQREDRADAVVAEALAPLVSDDVRDAGRPASRVGVGRAARRRVLHVSRASMCQPADRFRSASARSRRRTARRRSARATGGYGSRSPGAPRARTSRDRG